MTTNYRCTEPQIEHLCVELFNFLKSDLEKKVIHNKEVTKSTRGAIKYCEFKLGFQTIRMILKPYEKIDGVEYGSNEGATVVISLPFSPNGNPREESAQIRGYFSIRGREPQLTIIPLDSIKAITIGAKRIVTEKKVTTSNPVSVPSID